MQKAGTETGHSALAFSRLPRRSWTQTDLFSLAHEVGRLLHWAAFHFAPCPKSDKCLSALSNAGKFKPLKIHVPIVSKDVPNCDRPSEGKGVKKDKLNREGRRKIL
jgi:hypothetical protein